MVVHQRIALVGYLFYIGMHTIAATSPSGIETLQARQQHLQYRSIKTLQHFDDQHYEGSPFIDYLRGGGDISEEVDKDEEEETSDEYYYVEDIDSDDGGGRDDDDYSELLIEKVRSFLSVIGKAAIASSEVMARSIKAGYKGWKEAAHEELPIIDRFVSSIQEMWDAVAARTISVERLQLKEDPQCWTVEEEEEEEAFDYGEYLSNEYGINDDRTNSTTIYGGTINDALRLARHNARLLVVLILASKPRQNQPLGADYRALESLLSSEVADMAEKQARSKGETGSFILWVAEAESLDAIAAMKRLKAKKIKKKGEKLPIILVTYPAQIVSPGGVARIAPKSLAQHHCNPPPSSSSFASWLNTLRKRHGKLYATMQLELREAQLYNKRVEGYKTSIKSDVDRQEANKRETEIRIAHEAAIKEKEDASEHRRAILLESLPSEAERKAENVISVVLRFSNGQSGKRRFTSETKLATLFDWVDACFSIERENAVLTSMNGKQSYCWDDSRNEKTLLDAGFGKTTGLRVTIRKEKEEGIYS